MDKRSIFAYILIGLVLITYFHFSQPSAEQIQAQKELAEATRREELRKDSIVKADEAKFLSQIDDNSSLFYNVLKGENKNVTIQNEKIKVDISTYGGRIASVSLKDYEDQNGENVVIFDSKDKINVTEANKELNGSNTINFFFKSNLADRNINTNELFFTPVNATDSSVVMRLDFKKGGRYIDFEYSLLGNSQMVNLNVTAHNMNDIISGNEASITWKQFIRQLEPGYEFEQRFSSATYKPVDDDSDYLSQMADKSEKIEEPLKWLAYKNQFFSSIMIAGESFTGADIKSETIQKGKGLLKRCTSTMTPQVPSQQSSSSTSVLTSSTSSRRATHL